MTAAAIDETPSVTVKVHEVRQYELRGPLDFGTWWAVCTVNEVTGQLTVACDENGATYSHCWAAKHTGHATVLAAIRDGFGVHYLADKLFYGRTQERVDAEETEAEARRHVLQSRRSGHLTRDEARECWDELRDVDWSHQEGAVCGLSEINRIATKHFDPERGDALFCDPWEFIRHTANDAILHVRDRVLPAFKDALRLEQLAVAS